MGDDGAPSVRGDFIVELLGVRRGFEHGGIYALAGGFWGGGATNSGLFLPLILR